MTNIRDGILSECCRKDIPVVVFTTNGFQLKGKIIAFDGQVVVMDQNDGKQAMIYMSAISTVVPARPAMTNYEVRDYKSS